ncbi:hypothetical protein [Bacillus sp. T33-2]|uniref:hypothetical protein n=1 Tax=Bacillus sp. T33-2 TaxID=2054168 RepID=UPI00115AD05B|nr:hypothetical protein [Bacillus sp. T33-2]
MFNTYSPAEKITVSFEAAFEKIAEMIELKPVYVYDSSQQKYVLCGKIDCKYGVNASTGDVIMLDEI